MNTASKHPPVSEKSLSARERGFTRIDLVLCATVASLLFCLTLSSLARTASRGDRTVCSNNLRVIGRALDIWRLDRTKEYPWRTRIELGGNMGDKSRPGNAWFEILPIKDELQTPRVLACPSDTSVRVATEFSSNAVGGFTHFNYRGNAMSYLVGCDAFSTLPTAVTIGDRNIIPTSYNNLCSSGLTGVSIVPSIPWGHSLALWDDGLHQKKGNLLYVDGSVEFMSNDLIPHRGLVTPDDNGSTHFLPPR